MKDIAHMPEDKQFQMRVSEEFLQMLDDLRRMSPDLPSRAEMIRRLVTKTFSESQKGKKR